MTRVSFSADGRAVDVTLPTSCQQLTQKELRKFYKIIQLYQDHDISSDLRVPLFMICTGVRIESFDKKTDTFVLRFSRRWKSVRLRISTFDLAEHLEYLDFIKDPGDVPVMLDKVCGKKPAYDLKLHGLSFDKYLAIENRYQGFLSSKKVEALFPVAEILFEGFRADKHRLKSFEVFAIIQYLCQIKAMFARQFPNFFRSSGGETAASMLESMNNQIRALTGGDVIKENEVFATDCWRALTELDYKAKEAEEFRRQMAKTKH